MAEYTLDGQTVEDRAELHTALALALSLPDWYGRNLDALYDCLTSLPGETVLRIRHWASLEARLGDYAGRLRTVLTRAEEETSRFRLVVEDGDL